MDPLTHALLGASAAHLAFGRRLGRRAWMIGAVAGVLPDVEFFIRSAEDPLLNIEVHRQFTHAFAFIPVGGALAAAPWLLLKRTRAAPEPAVPSPCNAPDASPGRTPRAFEPEAPSPRDVPCTSLGRTPRALPRDVQSTSLGRTRFADWKPVLGAATLAYATHGLLDACTNYGTQLLWPFSDLRVAWHWLTTIGPLFTLMLLVGLVLSVRGGRRLPAALGLLGALAYVGVAAWQQERGLAAQAEIAAARGHVVERAKMFPTVGNVFLWRSVYEVGGVLHSDRIRAVDRLSWKPGSTVPLATEASLTPVERANPRIVRDYRRFAWFSDGWVARAPNAPDVYGDARYSLSLGRFDPIWGVRFRPDAKTPTEWIDFTARSRLPLTDLWREIVGDDDGYAPLPESLAAR